MNHLYLGDNLQILKQLESDSIDLIYLDPPFFSNRTYEVIWGDKGEIRSFEDRFSGGINHYIMWLKERVIEMHRVLKPTGSIYLHCDWHANSYIRTLILDPIFGMNNFRNEIVWHYDQGARSKTCFGRKHDTIWCYTKSNKWVFNMKEILVPYESKMTEWRYTNGGQAGKPMPEGKVPSDVWDFKFNTMSKERIGYPTQKPEALLERIIKASSNEGDIVLDPFMGGGTTIATAERLGRKWIGIDQSVAAVKVTEARLNKLQQLQIMQ